MIRIRVIAAGVAGAALLGGAPAGASEDATPIPPPAMRRLVLGRVVNIATQRREATVTDQPPDEELTDPEGDFGVVMLVNGAMEAYRLSSKERLWSKTYSPPCRRLVLGNSQVYAECAGKLLAFRRSDGESRTLEPGYDIDQVVISGPYLAAHHDNGIVALFDTRTDKKVARKALPQTSQATSAGMVASPAVNGLCVFGTHEGRSFPRGWALKAACYDWRLSPLWSRVVSFDLPEEPGAGRIEPSFAIRQEGPCHFVFNDDPVRRRGLGRGKGLVLHWSDGKVEEFTDHTFATIDGDGCKRLSSAAILDVLTKPPARAPGQEDFPQPQAVVARDRQRAYVLVMNDATRLAGIDLATARPLFVTPLALGLLVQQLDVAAGFPVVRTEFMGVSGRYWRASIHDPATGRVLYEDERPLR